MYMGFPLKNSPGSEHCFFLWGGQGEHHSYDPGIKLIPEDTLSVTALEMSVLEMLCPSEPAVSGMVLFLQLTGCQAGWLLACGFPCFWAGD